MYCCMVFTFFSSICEGQSMWSIMLNFTGWSPVMSSTCVLFMLKVVQVTLICFWNTYTSHCTLLKNVYKRHACGFHVFWNIKKKILCVWSSFTFRINKFSKTFDYIYIRLLIRTLNFVVYWNFVIMVHITITANQF